MTKLTRPIMYLSSALLMTFSLQPVAADGLFDLEAATVSHQLNFRVEDDSGIQRVKIGKDFRIRGWQISDRVYFGQAKVADKWGLGLVFERGNTAYGLNHRGFQVTKRF